MQGFYTSGHPSCEADEKKNARVNVRVNERRHWADFFARAMRVCACACFTFFFFPFIFLSLPTVTEPISKKKLTGEKKKKLLMCACFKSLKKCGWCCALVCLIGQI